MRGVVVSGGVSERPTAIAASLQIVVSLTAETESAGIAGRGITRRAFSPRLVSGLLTIKMTLPISAEVAHCAGDNHALDVSGVARASPQLDSTAARKNATQAPTARPCCP